MDWLTRTFYYGFRFGIKAWRKLFFDFKSWGHENIPEGPKIFCSNHISSNDPVFAITLMKEPVHVVMGSVFYTPFIKHFLALAEQINALPEFRKLVVDRAVNYLEQGESVYIFPEGTTGNQRGLKDFYPGLARIYLKHPVPIVPIGFATPRRNIDEKEVRVGDVLFHKMVVLSKNFYANIGEPLTFPEAEAMSDTKAAETLIMTRVKEEVGRLITDIKQNKFWSY